MQRADGISPETMKEKPMIRLPLFALTLVAGALPAAAQDIAGPAANEKVNQLIVYGEDRCEPSSPDEIVVCNRLPETARSRVPEIYRGGTPPAPRTPPTPTRVHPTEAVARPRT